MRNAAFTLFAAWCCFAVAGPVAAQSALEELEKQVRTPSLPAGAEEREAGYLGVIADDRQAEGRGIRIVEVVAGGPADTSGLRQDDLVVAIDGQPVRSMEAVGRLLAERRDGDRLNFDVVRGDKTERVEVTLGRRPPPEERRFRQFGVIPEASPPPVPTPRAGLLGIRAADVTPDVQLALGLPAARGALVVGVVSGSVAQEAGIPVDAVIVAVDGKPIDTPADLARLVAEAGEGKEIKVAYYSRGTLSERKITLRPVAEVQFPPPLGPVPRLPEVIGSSSRPGFQSDINRVATLERRVAELEQRLAELERKVLPPPKPDAEAKPDSAAVRP